jgi:hypothetical protein
VEFLDHSSVLLDDRTPVIEADRPPVIVMGVIAMSTAQVTRIGNVDLKGHNFLTTDQFDHLGRNESFNFQ